MSDVNKLYSAQTAVIGSLMINPHEIAGQLFHKVKPEDFTVAAWRNIFTVARELWMEGKPIDPVIVSAKTDEVYAQMLADAMRMTPTTVYWDEYADIMLQEGKLLKLKELGLALTDCIDLEEARKHLAKAEDLLVENSVKKSKTYAELLQDYIDRVNDKNPPKRLNWGFAPLDKLLTVSPGRFIVLGADSSVGKTAFALQLARGMAAAKQRVCFFSYETSCEDAMDRIMANAADVELSRSKNRCLSIEDFNRVLAEADGYNNIPLTVKVCSKETVDDLRCITLAGRYDVIFIDYAQLIPGRGKERWQVVTETSMSLHSMAQELGVTIIALSQVTPPEISKDGKRRMLGKEDLRESRQLNCDAEVILMMDLEFPKIKSSRRVLMIDKNKDGVCGKIFLDFDPLHMRFTLSTRAPTRAECEAAKMAELTEEETGPVPFR